jgi:hypothetical protein
LLKRGLLSFAGTADWKSDNGSFVNGFVRSHKTGAFTFPVGQSVYRPARISKAADAYPTDAAYFAPALFSKTALDDDIIAISDESWLIQGITGAQITLTWNPAGILALSWSSNISAFAGDEARFHIAPPQKIPLPKRMVTRWVTIPMLMPDGMPDWPAALLTVLGILLTTPPLSAGLPQHSTGLNFPWAYHR